MNTITTTTTTIPNRETTTNNKHHRHQKSHHRNHCMQFKVGKISWLLEELESLLGGQIRAEFYFQSIGEHYRLISRG